MSCVIGRSVPEQGRRAAGLIKNVLENVYESLKNSTHHYFGQRIKSVDDKFLYETCFATRQTNSVPFFDSCDPFGSVGVE